MRRGFPKPKDVLAFKIPFVKTNVFKGFGKPCGVPPHEGPAQNNKTHTIINPPGGGRRDCGIVIYIRLSFIDPV